MFSAQGGENFYEVCDCIALKHEYLESTGSNVDALSFGGDLPVDQEKSGKLLLLPNCQTCIGDIQELFVVRIQRSILVDRISNFTRQGQEWEDV